MTSPAQIKRWVSEKLPPQLRQWLWERKVAFGNRRIRELGGHLSKRIHQAAQKDFSLLERIGTKAEWESFRDERLHALRLSLTNNMTHPEKPDSVITGTLEQDRYRIDNVVFQGHMGLPVTAKPLPPDPNYPGNACDCYLSQSSRPKN
jgi:hypothetical protein